MGFFRKSRLQDDVLALAGFPELDDDALVRELERRMAGPQRHRLLQGYPMPKAMRPTGDDDGWESLQVTERRWREQLLVGVLPHPFCVPEVEGCGFCTFPHERHRQNLMLPLAMAIARELGTHKARHVTRADAIYLGGGTANLVSDDALRIIVAALVGRFGTGMGEVTLEGVPRFFRSSQLELLAELGARRVRLSMGVQTFDEGWLDKMGRMKIGAPAHVEEALALAREHGAQTSCDLLINLPGQPLDHMLRDVDTAAALGFDQICVYHLVLFEGLGTAWSRDAAMLEARPDNERAFESWRAVRRRLLELGFEQTTLTNFERRSLPDDERFAYERMSFDAASTSMIGVGPGAISGTGHCSGRQSIKWINPLEATAYLEASRMRAGEVRPTFIHAYDDWEDELVRLTRGLARLSVPRRANTSINLWLELFEPELRVLQRAGLLEEEVDKRRFIDAIRPTERGMFYADSIAGLLAHRTILHRRAKGHDELRNEAAGHHMG